MNREDAARKGISHGDVVKLSTPTHSLQVQIMLIDGVMPGTVMIEHGYGHKQLGAQSYTINGVTIPGHEQIKRGININDFGLLDDTKEIQSSWEDWVCGSCVRQGLPAKVERL